MKKFRFRLEKVLTIRRREEDAVRLELARLNRAVIQVQMEIERVERKLKECDVSRELSLSPELDPGEVFRRYQGYLGALETRIGEGRRRETELYQQRNEVNARLLEARRNRLLVEKLREKALSRHRLEVEREERKEMDEVASRRHAQVLRTTGAQVSSGFERGETEP